MLNTPGNSISSQPPLLCHLFEFFLEQPITLGTQALDSQLVVWASDHSPELSSSSNACR